MFVCVLVCVRVYMILLSLLLDSVGLLLLQIYQDNVAWPQTARAFCEQGRKGDKEAGEGDRKMEGGGRCSSESQEISNSYVCECTQERERERNRARARARFWNSPL